MINEAKIDATDIRVVGRRTVVERLAIDGCGEGRGAGCHSPSAASYMALFVEVWL
jgi:hypothetical protein